MRYPLCYLEVQDCIELCRSLAVCPYCPYSRFFSDSLKKSRKGSNFKILQFNKRRKKNYSDKVSS